MHLRKNEGAEDQGEVLKPLTVKITNEEVPVSHNYLLVCVVHKFMSIIRLCPSYVTLYVVIVVV